MTESERFRISLTEDLIAYLREEGFDTTSSSIWEARVWTGRAWESTLISICCFPGQGQFGEWSLSPMAGAGVSSCRIPFCDPLEKVIEFCQRVREANPQVVRWQEDVAGNMAVVKSEGLGELVADSP